MRKLLIPIQGDYVAQRFDLATEIIIVRFHDNKIIEKPKTIIMERPSDEELCQMIVEANITDVICGGIEELHYNFLVWKKINVIDAVIGAWQTAMHMAIAGELHQRAILPLPNTEVLSL